MESDPQRLELQMAVNCHVSAEKGAQVLWENSQCSYPWNHLSSPRHFNFKRITQDYRLEELLKAAAENTMTQIIYKHTQKASVHVTSDCPLRLPDIYLGC